MQLIAEGTGEDEELDAQLRKDAVENYVELLDKNVLPDILVQTMSWILGEYGYLSHSISQVQNDDTKNALNIADHRVLNTQADLIINLVDIAHRTVHDHSTRGFVITSIIKLVAQTGIKVLCPPIYSAFFCLLLSLKSPNLARHLSP